MDTINQNQPEENRQDLRGHEAVREIKDFVKQAENCFMCTANFRSVSPAARPMNVRQVDESSNLWFLSASDSHKNQELEHDPLLRLYFQGSKHSNFLQLDGRATISRDPAKIKELWEPALKT